MGTEGKMKINVGDAEEDHSSGSAYRNQRTESEVAILLTLNSGDRVQARYKERFSDFHVHEISPDGSIVRLQCLEPPVIENKIADEVPHSVLSPEVIANLEELNNKDPSSKDSVEIDVTNLDKNERKSVHKWIGKFDTLCTETMDKARSKLIKATKKSKDRRKLRRPDYQAKYTHCVMYKEGIETSEAVAFIAKKLNIKPNLISFAGTKDKQAKTSQLISIPNASGEKLREISEASKNIKLGNFKYKPFSLHLGQLEGNHFTILLKDVKVSPKNSPCSGPDVSSVIENAVSSLRKNGFINYFGLQRFGTHEVSTHLVGKILIQQDYEKAIDIMLRVKPKEPEYMKKVKSLWLETRDAAKCIELIPKWHRSLESNILYGLAKHGKDYQSVFLRLPRNSRLLYVHAFQSYVWNMMATLRIRQYGMEPVAGDLVLIRKDGQNESNASRDQFDDATAEDVPDLEIENSSVKTTSSVKVLREEDVGDYDITDVLLPLPGQNVIYPENTVRDCYHEFLSKEGLKDDWFMNVKPRNDIPSGAYRYLVVKPGDVDVEMGTYDEFDDLDSYIPSDLDVITSGRKKSKRNRKDDMGVAKNLVKISFSLPKSSYATMALREIMTNESPRDINQSSVPGCNKRLKTS